MEVRIAMNKLFKKDLVVFFLAFTALVCAAVNLNDSLNQFANK